MAELKRKTLCEHYTLFEWHISDGRTLYGQTSGIVFHVRDNARMSDNAVLSSGSSIRRNIILNGDVLVTSGCYLYAGTWSTGTITPGEGSPCGVDPELQTSSLMTRSIASTEELSSFNEATYTETKLASLETVKYKRPKKLKKKHERILKGIERHQASVKKQLQKSSQTKNRKPMKLEDVEALQKRSQEYKERVQTEARIRTAR